MSLPHPRLLSSSSSSTHPRDQFTVMESSVLLHRATRGVYQNSPVPVPCIFWPTGRCNRLPCLFLHDEHPLSSPSTNAKRSLLHGEQPPLLRRRTPSAISWGRRDVTASFVASLHASSPIKLFAAKNLVVSYGADANPDKHRPASSAEPALSKCCPASPTEPAPAIRFPVSPAEPAPVKRRSASPVEPLADEHKIHDTTGALADEIVADKQGGTPTDDEVAADTVRNDSDCSLGHAARASVADL